MRLEIENRDGDFQGHLVEEEIIHDLSQLQPQVLPFNQTNLESLRAQRKILEGIANSDQLKKNRSDFLTKNYITGLFKVIGINDQKLTFISENQLISQVLRFLIDGCSVVKYRRREGFKTLEGFISILIEGGIKKVNDSYGYENNQTERCLQSILNYQVQYNLQALGKRSRNASRRRLSRQSRKSSSIVKKTENSRQKNSKFVKQKTIFSDEQHEPKVLSMGISEGRQYECMSEVSVVYIAVAASRKLEGFLDFSERQILGKFICNVLGMKESIKASKLAAKVQKHFLPKKTQITLNSETIYLVFSGDLLLTMPSSLGLQVKENSVLNPLTFQNDEESLGVATCTSECIILSLEDSEIKEVYELYPEVIEDIRHHMKKIRKERNQLFGKMEKRNQGIIDLQAWELNCQHFNTLMGLQKEYRNRFRVNKEDKKIMGDWHDSQHMGNYPYVKLIDSYNRADTVMRNFRKTHKCSEKKRGKTNQSNHKPPPVESRDMKIQKKQYYNEKVRRMKIKNIAQKVIPNAGKRNFQSQQIQKKIFDNSLFATTFEHPWSNCKSSKNQSKRKKSVYCRVLQKRQEKSLKNSSYNSLFEEEVVLKIGIKKIQHRQGNGSFFDGVRWSDPSKHLLPSGNERKDRYTTTDTDTNKDNQRLKQHVEKFKKDEKKKAPITQENRPDRRIKTAGNDQ